MPSSSRSAALYSCPTTAAGRLSSAIAASSWSGARSISQISWSIRRTPTASSRPITRLSCQPTAARASPRPATAHTVTGTICGSTRRTRCTSSGATMAGCGHRSTAATGGGKATTFRSRSSTTSVSMRPTPTRSTAGFRTTRCGSVIPPIREGLPTTAGNPSSAATDSGRSPTRSTVTTSTGSARAATSGAPTAGRTRFATSSPRLAPGRNCASTGTHRFIFPPTRGGRSMSERSTCSGRATKGRAGKESPPT